jgi:predicted MFS family arabinose efflux permease
MLQVTLDLYKNAYGGLSRATWRLSWIMLVNRAGTMVIPFLTVYLTERGHSLSVAGMIMAAFGAGAIVGGYLGGWLTDRVGAYYVQLWSLLLNGALFIVLGYVQNIIAFGAVIFILSSIGEAFRPANSAAIAAASGPENRTRSYSLNRLAINLGFTIGPAVGGMLADYDYHLLFWADGLTCMAAAFFVWLFFRQDVVKPVHEQERVSAFSVLKDKPFLYALVFLLMTMLCFLQLFSIIPVYFSEGVGMSKTAIGWLLASNGLMIVLVEMVLVYRLEKRESQDIYIAAGALMMAASFGVLAIAPVVAFAVIAMLLVTMGEMLLFPFMNRFWVDRTNAHNRGRYAAWYTITFAIAHVLAPAASAMMQAIAGYRGLFIFDLALCSLGAIGFLWLRKL